MQSQTIRFSKAPKGQWRRGSVALLGALALALIVGPGAPTAAAQERRGHPQGGAGRTDDSPRITAAEWRKMDAELLEIARQFIGLDLKRHRLLAEYGKLRNKHVAGDASISSVMAGKRIRDLIARYEGLLSEFRPLQRRARAISWTTYSSRETLGETLNRRRGEIRRARANRPRGDRVRAEYELGRIETWRGALEKAKSPGEVVMGVIGPETGLVLMVSYSNAWRSDRSSGRPRPDSRPLAGGPADAQAWAKASPEERRQWLGERLHQLTRNNRRARERISNREEEIERLEIEFRRLKPSATGAPHPSPDANNP